MKSSIALKHNKPWKRNSIDWSLPCSDGSYECSFESNEYTKHKYYHNHSLCRKILTIAVLQHRINANVNNNNNNNIFITLLTGAILSAESNGFFQVVGEWLRMILKKDFTQEWLCAMMECDHQQEFDPKNGCLWQMLSQTERKWFSCLHNRHYWSAHWRFWQNTKCSSDDCCAG